MDILALTPRNSGAIGKASHHLAPRPLGLNAEPPSFMTAAPVNFTGAAVSLPNCQQNRTEERLWLIDSIFPRWKGVFMRRFLRGGRIPIG